jgi:hypothetical protein
MSSSTCKAAEEDDDDDDDEEDEEEGSLGLRWLVGGGRAVESPARRS